MTWILLAITLMKTQSSVITTVTLSCHYYCHPHHHYYDVLTSTLLVITNIREALNTHQSSLLTSIVILQILSLSGVIMLKSSCFRSHNVPGVIMLQELSCFRGRHILVIMLQELSLVITTSHHSQSPTVIPATQGNQYSPLGPPLVQSSPVPPVITSTTSHH